MSDGACFAEHLSVEVGSLHLSGNPLDELPYRLAAALCCQAVQGGGNGCSKRIKNHRASISFYADGNSKE
jgi:hypothetical protein